MVSESDEDGEDSSSSSLCLSLCAFVFTEPRRTVPDPERVSLAPLQRTLS